MELYTANCLSTENKPTLELSKLVKDEKSSVKTNSENTLTLVNHGAKMWQENREKWVGDQSRQRKKHCKGSDYKEMVDFLVDIWYDEGLYD
ncbi:hypothetical protein AtEden1_Chr3g0211481 [Arabidopsis thaliana]